MIRGRSAALHRDRGGCAAVDGEEKAAGLGSGACELEGHGPISAVLARALSFTEGSTWRRLVTDPVTGQLLDYGRTKYKPPAPLEEFARARDMLCRTVNCDHPASKCDLDHTERFPDGPTSAVNLHSHCRRHHRLKHVGGWKHEVLNDPAYPKGTLKITSPTGHVYYSHPPKIGPITATQEQDSSPGSAGRPGRRGRRGRPSDSGPPPF